MGDILSFQSTVPKRFVHRQAVAEVFLTDCLAQGEGRFLLGAQWPRLHAFYRTCSGRYDTMILAETLRQSAIYLAHVQFAVPLRYHFTMQALRIDATLDLMSIGTCSAETVIDARVVATSRQEGVLSAFTVHVEFNVGGRVIGSGSAVANVLAPESYLHARWQGAGPRAQGKPPMPTPVDRHAICATDRRAIVLGELPGGAVSGKWLLRADVTHPVLFDHPLDHVPGTLILEAARQGARLLLAQPCADVESIEMEFRRFLEIDEPTTVAVRPVLGDSLCVAVKFTQWGESKAVGFVRLSNSVGRSHHQSVDAGCQRT